MKKINIAVFGASSRCIALAARELTDNVVVKVFFDNDKNKKGGVIHRGYQYIENSKIYVPFDNVRIDLPSEYHKYQFDYVVIMAGKKSEIEEQLIDLGINKGKIIVFDRMISSGELHVPMLEKGAITLESILEEAAKQGINQKKYLQNAENLLCLCEKIFNSKYKKYILDIFVVALKASIEKRVIEYNGVKFDHKMFSDNVGLFMYESADIFLDTLEEELGQFEHSEGPYSSYGVEVEKDDIVFDFGANYGMFSAIAATKAKSGKVYAFEPVERTRHILEQTVKLYNNIEICSYAIGDRTEKIEIDVSMNRENAGAASIMNVGMKSSVEVVDMISLDQFVEKYNIEKVDFIKADIEGAERLLLLGGVNVLKKFAPKIAICTYHYPEDAALLEFLIKSANPNYVVEKAYCKLYAYVNKYNN